MARRATAARKLREKAEAEESARRAAVGGLTEAEYVMRRITRTREQIEELDRKMSRSSDPRAIKALSDAMKNLAELERVLSGRPLPGSNKPSSPPRKAGSNGQISPLD